MFRDIAYDVTNNWEQDRLFKILSWNGWLSTQKRKLSHCTLQC